jgi:hypothetical protein
LHGFLPSTFDVANDGQRPSFTRRPAKHARDLFIRTGGPS